MTVFLNENLSSLLVGAIAPISPALGVRILSRIHLWISPGWRTTGVHIWTGTSAFSQRGRQALVDECWVLYRVKKHSRKLIGAKKARLAPRRGGQFAGFLSPRGNPDKSKDGNLGYRTASGEESQARRPEQT